MVPRYDMSILDRTADNGHFVFSCIYMENMNSIYCKKQKENGNTFILKIVKMTDHLGILILEESAAYLGKAINNYLKETAAYFSLDVNTYCSDVEKYIKHTNPDIKISFTDDRFSISKKVGKMNICYFSVDLEQTDLGTMAINIATELLSLYKDANVKAVEANDRFLQLQSSRDTYKEILEKYTNEHNNSENQLYSSFLLILNEKKRQLQFYKDLLDKAQANQISNSPTRITLSDNEALDDNSLTRVILSDDDDDDEVHREENYNTDDEKDLKSARSTNNGLKRISSSSFDSDGEPLPGPSKVVKKNHKNWKKTKSAEFNKKPINATKLDSRSKSDTNLGAQRANDFNINCEDFDEDFDLLDADIIPKLPKRIKSTSNITAVVKTAAVCSQVVENNILKESPEIGADSPTANFSTQDLFDRM